MREFAARLGVDHKSVSGWEAGKRLPDGSSLLALMEQFSADVNYILTGQLSGGLATPAPAAKPLARDEEILLDNYRNSPPDAKAVIKAASDAAARTARGAKRDKAA